MKKTRIKQTESTSEDMLPEYNFRGMKGVRGKYYQAMRGGYTITIHNEDGTILVKKVKPKTAIFLEPDLLEHFPDSKSVNAALRSLIAPRKHAMMAKESRAKYDARSKGARKGR
jgi:hypothetical protein